MLCDVFKEESSNQTETTRNQNETKALSESNKDNNNREEVWGPTMRYGVGVGVILELNVNGEQETFQESYQKKTSRSVTHEVIFLFLSDRVINQSDFESPARSPPRQDLYFQRKLRISKHAHCTLQFRWTFPLLSIQFTVHQFYKVLSPYTESRIVCEMSGLQLQGSFTIRLHLHRPLVTPNPLPSYYATN